MSATISGNKVVWTIPSNRANGTLRTTFGSASGNNSKVVVSNGATVNYSSSVQSSTVAVGTWDITANDNNGRAITPTGSGMSFTFDSGATNGAIAISLVENPMPE